jgi:hypothetical protein
VYRIHVAPVRVKVGFAAVPVVMGAVSAGTPDMAFASFVPVGVSSASR